MKLITALNTLLLSDHLLFGLNFPLIIPDILPWLEVIITDREEKQNKLPLFCCSLLSSSPPQATVVFVLLASKKS